MDTSISIHVSGLHTKNKNKKQKCIHKPQKIADINSKNQKKKKAKQLARKLFKITNKMGIL
jgi:hypothetical protein